MEDEHGAPLPDAWDHDGKCLMAQPCDSMLPGRVIALCLKALALCVSCAITAYYMLYGDHIQPPSKCGDICSH